MRESMFKDDPQIWPGQLSQIMYSDYSRNKIFDCILDFDKLLRPVKSIFGSETEQNSNKSVQSPFEQEILTKKIYKKDRVGEYRKNICGYITKKVIREFIDCNYKQEVTKLCQDEKVSYAHIVKYYSMKLEKVTGPTHIEGLLISYKKDDIRYSKVFLKFFLYFLNERYIRYLINEGRMFQKVMYLEYKNRQLIPRIKKIEKKLRNQIIQ